MRQEKILEYKLLFQQLQQLQQNIHAVGQHLEDLKKIQENIETISSTSSGTETLVPLGSGIFLKAQVKDTTRLIMNVGASICVEKTPLEAVEAVSKQLIEMEQLFGQLEEEAERTAEQIQYFKKEMGSLERE